MECSVTLRSPPKRCTDSTNPPRHRSSPTTPCVFARRLVLSRLGLGTCLPGTDYRHCRQSVSRERSMGKHFSAARLISCALGACLAAAGAGGAAAQDNKAMVIKLATATLNDAQHEWLK